MALDTIIQEEVFQTGFLLPKGKISQNKREYCRYYYQNNRQKLLTYSNDYYQVQKLLQPYLKEEKITKESRKEYQKQYQKNPKRKEYKKQ